MQYRQFLPAPHLAPYIEAYWMVRGVSLAETTEKLLPDGCIDIILNLGEDFLSDDGDFLMKHGQAYLVGTMTRFKKIIRRGENHHIGIRFKPAAFSHFYQPAGLHEFVDQSIAFNTHPFPLPAGYVFSISTSQPSPIQDQILLDQLNLFFSQRLSLSGSAQYLTTVLEDAARLEGRVHVETLAKRHFMSPRKLERIFKLHTGASPKEFLNFFRFQSALERVRNNHAGNSLLGIAFDSGYYDHAHLANEFKKYTGSTPSEFNPAGR